MSVAISKPNLSEYLNPQLSYIYFRFRKTNVRHVEILLPVSISEVRSQKTVNVTRKWNNVWSSVFDIAFGVRQGSVLSPFLFALYLDDLAKLCGCFIILYADDILLISPSVVYLEQLLHACERELHWLDMAINFDKSCE